MSATQISGGYICVSLITDFAAFDGSARLEEEISIDLGPEGMICYCQRATGGREERGCIYTLHMKSAFKMLSRFPDPPFGFSSQSRKLSKYRAVWRIYQYRTTWNYIEIGVSLSISSRESWSGTRSDKSVEMVGKKVIRCELFWSVKVKVVQEVTNTLELSDVSWMWVILVRGPKSRLGRGLAVSLS